MRDFVANKPRENTDVGPESQAQITTRHSLDDAAQLGIIQSTTVL